MKKRWLYYFAGIWILALSLQSWNRPVATSEKGGLAGGQPFPLDSLPLEAIRHEADTIGNAGALAPLFRKLDSLEHGENCRVRIVHIGDSHIQADYFTGELRTLFQRRFGNAGRGLVFPYPLAGTHAPVDLSFRSNCQWENRRNVFQKTGPPLGIAGISIESSFSRPSIELTIKDRYEGMDYAFDRITIFQEKDVPFIALAPAVAALPPSPGESRPPVRKPVVYTVKAGDTLYGLARRNNCSVAELQQWNRLSSPDHLQVGQQLVVGMEAAVAPIAQEPHGDRKPAVCDKSGDAFDRYLLPATGREIALLPAIGGSGTTRIYGLLLENSQNPGVLYNMIGVNGATYYHYNRAGPFWDQLPALEPDLVVVSLGTNEALAGNFTAPAFRAEVLLFLEKLRQALGDVPVLLTTNPDVLRRRRYENPANELVREIILEGASLHQAAWWDLQEVMGGPGSVRRWRDKGLAHTDFIHFTREGYILQARLLFEALG